MLRRYETYVHLTPKYSCIFPISEKKNVSSRKAFNIVCIGTKQIILTKWLLNKSNNTTKEILWVQKPYTKEFGNLSEVLRILSLINISSYLPILHKVEHDRWEGRNLHPVRLCSFPTRRNNPSNTNNQGGKFSLILPPPPSSSSFIFIIQFQVSFKWTDKVAPFFKQKRRGLWEKSWAWPMRGIHGTLDKKLLKSEV